MWVTNVVKCPIFNGRNLTHRKHKLLHYKLHLHCNRQMRDVLVQDSVAGELSFMHLGWGYPGLRVRTSASATSFPPQIKSKTNKQEKTNKTTKTKKTTITLSLLEEHSSEARLSVHYVVWLRCSVVSGSLCILCKVALGRWSPSYLTEGTFPFS